jgi:hypothetical protein
VAVLKFWEIEKTTYKISDFVSWQRAGTLELSPSFQRRPVWKSGAKSYLVDSVVRALPMPIIFLRDRKVDLSKLEPTREVVDGQQRIRTLLGYIDKSLLKDFNPAMDEFVVLPEHNSELADKTFKELDDDIRQQILGYQFSVHVLPASSDDREVLEIFARMNSTGVKLNPQELRNAEYFGRFKTDMYRLATEQLYRWREWKVFTEFNIARMDEVELTSELVLLILKGLSQKTQKAIDKAYATYDVTFPERNEAVRRFRTVMDSIANKLGPEISGLAFRGRPLFYDLFAYFYDLQFGLGTSMSKGKPKSISGAQIERVRVVSEKISRQTAPEAVLNAVARRTTHLASRRAIVKYLNR